MYFISVLFIVQLQIAFGQETVFNIWKRDGRLADEHYENKNYQAAFTIYANLYRKDSSSQIFPVKLARCSYYLKNYTKAITLFGLASKKNILSSEDHFLLAESLTASGDYKKAIQVYRDYLKLKPGDPLITQKIWRLNNIQYLYEDSLHYAVRPISLNTENGELCPAPFNNGLVFISNRQNTSAVETIDGTLNKPFYKTYFSAAAFDSLKNNVLAYKRPGLFHRDFYSGLHAGPLAFYANDKKMVFTSTSDKTGVGGKKTIQLLFAAEVNGKWKVTGAFPYNNNSYSINDPSINEEGTTLYFSSDMPGGLGGKDLYRSAFKNNEWTKPENLGEVINTSYDEVFPYLHQNTTLYFSSNGHPGLGGLDIYKSQIREHNFDEVLNAGYPINTNADEFGIIIDSLSTHGYLTSNRVNGGYDDDIFEFDMDLQTYPLELSGTMKYKEFNLGDADLKPFANAKFYLIDNIREITVQEGTSDENGNFKWAIPYYSKYRIRVLGEDNDEHIVSLEIPKHRHSHSTHEIVIVKDAFHSPENQQKK